MYLNIALIFFTVVLTPSPARQSDMLNKYLRRSAEKENLQVDFSPKQKSGNDTPTNKSTAEKFSELHSHNEDASKVRSAREADGADRFSKLRNMLLTKSPTSSHGTQAKE